MCTSAGSTCPARACRPRICACPQPRGVVFFLHGNSGNLQDCLVDLDAFRQVNFDVVMFDYRGYGKSSGCIESEEQLRADVRTVWARVRASCTRASGW